MIYKDLSTLHAIARPPHQPHSHQTHSRQPTLPLPPSLPPSPHPSPHPSTTNRSPSGSPCLRTPAITASEIVNIESTASTGTKPDPGRRVVQCQPEQRHNCDTQAQKLSAIRSIPSRSSFLGNNAAINEYPGRKRTSGALRAVMCNM